MLHFAKNRLSVTGRCLLCGLAALALVGVLSLAGGCDSSEGSWTPNPTSQQGTETASNRPSIVFVLIDTLRADRLGAYGGPKDLTPCMDQIAAEGVAFDRAIAQAPWTLPSVASLFSGVYPTVHKANDYDVALAGKAPTGVSVRVLPESVNTLAERLRDDGYETAGFVANLFLKPKFGMNQGFDHYDDSFAANDTPGGTVNAAAIQWLAARKSDKPFFAYLHYMDVHAPYTSDDRFVEPLVKRMAGLATKTRIARQEMNNHPGYFSKSARPYMNNPLHRPLLQYREYWWARYDAGVRQADFYLNELRSELIKLGLWDNVVFVVTADHGEALGEHGIWTHGLSAHQDQLHVPLILRWPGHWPAGKRIKASVRMFDVMPTLLEITGAPTDSAIQAASLSGLIDGRDMNNRLALGEAVKHNPTQGGLVDGRWKLFVDRKHDLVQLFDLDTDPTEQHDVAAEYTDVVARLSAALEALQKENAARARGQQGARRGATPEEIKRLQGLGYVGDDEDDQDGGG